MLEREVRARERGHEPTFSPSSLKTRTEHVPRERPQHVSAGAAAGGGCGKDTFKYKPLLNATKNFVKSLTGGGFGSVFEGVLVSGTRVAVKRLELNLTSVTRGGGISVISIIDQMRTEVEVLSKMHHINIVPMLRWSKDGMAPCLVSALMRDGSLQDRLTCRGNGDVSLTVNDRILVLSDVSRGLTCLHSEQRLVKNANVLLDEGYRGNVGDFGITRPLNDYSVGITVTQIQTEHVMGTQVYMTPEYKNVNLSAKVDAFVFGLVVIETLTGYAVCSPEQGHLDLLSMCEQELDSVSQFIAHLDKRACWEQHTQESIDRLYDIADRCLETSNPKRPELVEFIPDLQEVRHVTETLQAIGTEWTVNILLETQAPEKECCICLETDAALFLRSVSRADGSPGTSNEGQTGDPSVRLTFPL